MNDRTPMTRRELLAGLAAAGGMMLTGCSPTDPPTYGNLLRAGDLLTYKAHRLLLPRQSLAREYQRHDITSIPAVGTSDPADPAGELYSADFGTEYDRLRAGGWAEWRLAWRGSWPGPASFSLADLKSGCSYADHPPHLRRGLVGHRRVDRGAPGRRARGLRRASSGALRAPRRIRRRRRQHRHDRRAASADHPRLGHERPRSAPGPRGAAPAPRRPPDRVQEREIPAPDPGHRGLR